MTRHLPQTEQTIDQNVELKSALDRAAQQATEDQTAEIMRKKWEAIRARRVEAA